MRTRCSWVAVVALVALGACAPPACSEDADRKLRQDVRLLSEDDGALGQAAKLRLVAAGSEAVLILETGLYAAHAQGRRRIVETLAQIRSKEALPILVHLARRDPDPEVRQAAENARNSLASLP